MADLKMEADPRFRKHGPPDSVQLGQLQCLLHDALLSTRHVDQCALIRRSNASVAAASVGFKLYPEQARMFVDSFGGAAAHTRQHGVHYHGLLHRTLRADTDSVYAQTEGREGLLLVQTRTLVLMASYTPAMQPSVAVEAVEALGEYLREKGK